MEKEGAFTKFRVLVIVGEEGFFFYKGNAILDFPFGTLIGWDDFRINYFNLKYFVIKGLEINNFHILQ